jgi:hypothetical protein
VVSIEALAQIGPVGLVLACIAAIIRGDLVPGYIFRREQKRADDADHLLRAIARKSAGDDSGGV